MSIQVSGVYGGGAKLNGVKGEYLATADVAKGDFVQLTTMGVEEPVFTEVGAFVTTPSDVTGSSQMKNGVAVSVLSETKMVYTYIETPAYGSAKTVQIYAQAANYINGSWVLGTACLIHTPDATTPQPDVNITRLDDNRAAIIFASYGSGSAYYASACFVLDISESGEITVAASAVDPFIAKNSTRDCPVRIVSLSETNFVTLTPHHSSSYGGLIAVSFVYDETEKTLLYSSPVVLYVGTSSVTRGEGYVSACKLNNNTVFVSTNNGSSNMATGSYTVFLLHVTGTNLNMETYVKTNSLFYGPVCQLSENVVAHVAIENGKASCIFTYSPETNTMTEQVFFTTGNYMYHEVVKLSDDKLCALIGDMDDTSPAAYNLSVIDIATGTETIKATAIDSTGYVEITTPHRCDAYAGWMGIASGITSIIAAPTISTTTAAPYNTRLDGVCTKGATAGSMATVITPE